MEQPFSGRINTVAVTIVTCQRPTQYVDLGYPRNPGIARRKTAAFARSRGPDRFAQKQGRGSSG